MADRNLEGASAGTLPSVGGVYQNAYTSALMQPRMVIQIHGTHGFAHFFNDPPQLTRCVEVLVPIAQGLQGGA